MDKKLQNSVAILFKNPEDARGIFPKPIDEKMSKKVFFYVALVGLFFPLYIFSKEVNVKNNYLKRTQQHRKKTIAYRSFVIRDDHKNDNRPTVTSKLIGQLGNNLFEVAAATALALDNNADTFFSEFTEDSPIYKHVFFRCKIHVPSEEVDFTWGEPSANYNPIRYVPKMKLWGYFQSEKYFVHHRDYLLSLFAPHPDDLEYMKSKYGWLIDCPNTVGVQLRYYKWEDWSSSIYPQYGKEYLEKAMAFFSPDTTFIVSSNNLEYAKKCIPEWAKNVYFIENEPNYIDLYLLSFCKHNIITNSSFGWWGAWLNQNPDKIVVAPSLLFYNIPFQDYCPDTWLRIEADPDRT